MSIVYLCNLCGARLEMPAPNVVPLRCLLCGSQAKDPAEQPTLDLILPESEGGA